MPFLGDANSQSRVLHLGIIFPDLGHEVWLALRAFALRVRTLALSLRAFAFRTRTLALVGRLPIVIMSITLPITVAITIPVITGGFALHVLIAVVGVTFATPVPAIPFPLPVTIIVPITIPVAVTVTVAIPICITAGIIPPLTRLPFG